MISGQSAKDAAEEGKRLLEAHQPIIREIVHEMAFGTRTLSDRLFLAWWEANAMHHRMGQKLETDVDGTITGVPGSQYPVEVDYGPAVWPLALSMSRGGMEDIARYEKITGTVRNG